MNAEAIKENRLFEKGFSLWGVVEKKGTVFF